MHTFISFSHCCLLFLNLLVELFPNTCTNRYKSIYYFHSLFINKFSIITIFSGCEKTHFLCRQKKWINVKYWKWEKLDVETVGYETTYVVRCTYEYVAGMFDEHVSRFFGRHIKNSWRGSRECEAAKQHWIIDTKLNEKHGKWKRIQTFTRRYVYVLYCSKQVEGAWKMHTYTTACYVCYWILNGFAINIDWLGYVKSGWTILTSYGLSYLKHSWTVNQHLSVIRTDSTCIVFRRQYSLFRQCAVEYFRHPSFVYVNGAVGTNGYDDEKLKK